MLRRNALVTGLLLGMSLGHAQPLTFEVASLKPAASGDRVINLGTASHGQVTLTNVSLSDALKFAFGITNDAQISGPDWIAIHREQRDLSVMALTVGKTGPTFQRETGLNGSYALRLEW